MGSIAVVGGGIVGLSLAYHLRQTSRDVTVYEKRAPGAGTTGKSIACFGRHLAADEVERELMSRSWDVYEPLVAERTLSYHETGLMVAAETEAFFAELRASADAAREAARSFRDQLWEEG